MYGGDLTQEDVRRMDSVGNDVVNRKFLAVWDSREFPPPDRRNKDALREFIWLKYEGIFKKNQAPNPRMPQQDPAPRDYYDNRGYDPNLEHQRRERSMRREQELFRDGAVQADRQRGYWASRFGTPRAAQQPHPASTPYPEHVRRPRDDYYGRSANAPPYPDRYRTGVPHDRFQPPQPTPVVPYGLPRNSRPRYREDVYEEYASNASSRDRERRQSERSSTKPSSQGSYSDEEEERREKKKKSSKHSSKSRRKKSDYVESDQEYENDDDYEPDERESRTKKSSKKSKKKSSKEGKSRRKREEYKENGTYDQEEYSSEEEERLKSKSSRRKARETNSAEAEGAGSQTSLTPPAKTEFDLMSEWMGDNKEAENPSTASPVVGGAPSAQSIPQAMQQAYQTAQMPMIPPMSMYTSVMPMPGGGFMPMMAPPGMMPTPMGMPGMPGMPPLPPGLMGGMPQMPNAPSVPQGGGMSGMPGLINGMRTLNMNPGAQPMGATQIPPPPPPVGMPAGPPPGPPPEPPANS